MRTQTKETTEPAGIISEIKGTGRGKLKKRPSDARSPRGETSATVIVIISSRYFIFFKNFVFKKHGKKRSNFLPRSPAGDTHAPRRRAKACFYGGGLACLGLDKPAEVRERAEASVLSRPSPPTVVVLIFLICC